MTKTGLERPCPRCFKPALFLVRLHGDKGGPELCMQCGNELLGRAREGAERDPFTNSDGMFSLDRLFGGVSGANEIYRELLDDAIALTHPDLHTPARGDLATRVTAELTRLRKYAKPKPAPPPPPKTSNGSTAPVTNDSPEPSRPPYPCGTCRHLLHVYYCDDCKAERVRRATQCDKCDAELPPAKRRPDRSFICEACIEAEREKAKPWGIDTPTCAVCGVGVKWARGDTRYCSDTCARKARALYRQQNRKPRHCEVCAGKLPVSARKDAAYCSRACRQRAYRQRRRSP